MNVTEAEARKLWCPFARVLITDADDRSPVVSANRLEGIGRDCGPDLDWPSPRCIASDCMAWAFETAHTEVSINDQHTGHAESPPGEGWERDGGGCGKAKWRRPSTKERTGYCGLAERG